MRADFRRKEPEVAVNECVIEKVIVLPDAEYDYFTQHLLHDYDFIDENRGLMGEWNGAWHCLLVTGDKAVEGVLVQSEGSSYARYSAFVPSVSDLIVQEKCVKYGYRETGQSEGCSQQMV